MSESREQWARRHHCAQTDFEDLAWVYCQDTVRLRAKVDEWERIAAQRGHRLEQIASVLRSEKTALGFDPVCGNEILDAALLMRERAERAEKDRDEITDAAEKERDKLRAEVERLRAEANARAAIELQWVANMMRGGVFDSAWTQARIAIADRIAELSKPAAKESEPARCAERVWASGDMEACGKPLPCSDHTKPEEEPDWTVTLAAQAKNAYALSDEPADESAAKLLAMVVQGLCNLGREVRRGGKS